MNNNLTDINVVLDRSGSMERVKTDTIGGFNEFLRTQKEAQGEANLTLAQFDDEYEIVYDGISIKDVPELTGETFLPRGYTALLDAIGCTIIASGARLAGLPEALRPANVIFVILTDGHENRSTEFTLAKINEMIQHQTDVYHWDFVFLGANQDAILTGRNLGIKTGNSMAFATNEEGVTHVFRSVSRSMLQYRMQPADTTTNFFLDEDRENQKKSGA